MDTNNGTGSVNKALKYSYPAIAPKMKITLNLSSIIIIIIFQYCATSQTKTLHRGSTIININ